MKAIFPIFFVLCWVSLLAQTPRLVVPAGHTGEITAVAISPDGKLILTGSGDNTAKLWDVSGHEIRTFSGHEFVVSAVAFSPDGKSVLTGSYDGTARLWDLNGNKPTIFKGHSNYVTSVAFAPDGKSVLTGSYDGSAKLWDLTGKVRQTFTASGRVWAVAFASDGKLIAIGDESGTAQCWNLYGGKQQTFRHQGAVRAVAFSSDGQSVLAGCEDGTAKLWDISGSARQTISRSGAVRTVAISPDNQCLLTGNFNDGIVEIQTPAGKRTLEYKGHSWGVNAAVFSPDGRYVLTGSADRTARLWDLNGKTIRVFDKHTVGITALACSGQFMLCGNKEGEVKRFDLGGFSVQNYDAHRQEINSVAISSDGQLFLTGSRDGSLKLFDSTGLEKKFFEQHKSWVNAVTFAPNGQWILSGSADKTAVLWKLSDYSSTTLSHGDEVNTVAFSPDGQLLLTGSADGNATIWTLAGKQQQVIPVRSQIKALAFAPDGKTFVTGTYNGLVQQWDLNGTLVQTFGRASDAALCVTFSPDGKTVLAGFEDKSAKLWRVEDGQRLHDFTGHSAEVTSVAFLSDGKFMITASRDGSIRFWDAGSGAERVAIIPIDKNDWVAMNGEGLFDASPSATKIMYYADGLEVIELEQLKEVYFEPHLLLKALGFAGGGIRPVDDLSNLNRYPLISLATIEGDLLRVQLKERNGGVGRVALLLNDDIELEPNANPEFKSEFTVDLTRFGRYFVENENNRLSLRAYNKEGWLKGQHYFVDYRPAGVSERGLQNNTSNPLIAKKDADLETIKLYALIVGTAKFRGEQLNLKYPEKDAHAFATALDSISKKLFGENREIKVLTTDAAAESWPRKSVIEAALKDFAARADANDLLLLYFSGHGITYPPNSEKGRFYYLTTDILSDKLDDPTVLNSQAICQDTLQKWTREIAARKRILILDACNAGKVVQTLGPGEKALNSDQRRALESMKDRSGMFVLAGSAADKSSFEASRFGHGLLTYSLLNNMPLVALENKKQVEVGELFNYAYKQVPLLAKEIDREQNPELIGAGSWSIGIIDGEAPFEMPAPLPVFIRTNFIDLDKNRDQQHLAKALNKALEYLASQSDPALTFWDVAESPGDHFYIGGKYKVVGTEITGDATLYRRDKELVKFPFVGKVGAMEKLVEDILDKAGSYVTQ